MTTLADIARDMIHQATRTGVCDRDLPGGLTIKYVRIAGESTLRLSRPIQAPTDAEISQMRLCFQVPAAPWTRTGPNWVEFRW